MKKLIRKVLNRLAPVKEEDVRQLYKEIDRLYGLIENKLWEEQKHTNMMLYNMYLSQAKINKKFKPLVSIIIPVYNGSNFLSYAIDSALNQTYKNIEIIVVNDGSTDEGKSKEIALKYGKKIRYYEKENGGVSTALNYGIKKMKGEYFAWLSHDDLIEPTHIEKLVEYVSIKGNEKTIPYSAFKVIDEFGTIKVKETISAQLHCFDYKTSVLENEFTLLKGEINGGSVLIPKEAFAKHGLFAEEQRITQERDMWARLITEYKFISIPYETAMLREHSKRVTHVNPRIKIETDEKNLEIIKNASDKKIKKLGLDRTSFYKAMSVHYDIYGNTYMKEEIKKLYKEELKNKDK